MHHSTLAAILRDRSAGFSLKAIAESRGLDLAEVYQAIYGDLPEETKRSKELRLMRDHAREFVAQGVPIETVLKVYGDVIQEDEL